MSVCVVEIWGGALTLGALGPGAEGALAACARQVEGARGEIEEDAGLLAQRLMDLLPRTPAGRRAAEARRHVAQALRVTDEQALPPALVALPGAMADEAVAYLTDRDGVESAFALAKSFAAYSGPGIAFDSDGQPVGELADQIIGDGFLKGAGGIGFSGVAHETPSFGVGEHVACVAESAAIGLMAAAMMADGTGLSSSSAETAPVTGVYGPAYQGIVAVGGVGVLAPDEIWEALSGGMRVAQRLKSAGILKAGVLTLKGRGRVVGPVEPDRLLRFGVSEWR